MFQAEAIVKFLWFPGRIAKFVARGLSQKIEVEFQVGFLRPRREKRCSGSPCRVARERLAKRGRGAHNRDCYASRWRQLQSAFNLFKMGVGNGEWGVGNGSEKQRSHFPYYPFPLPTPHSLRPSSLLHFPRRLSSLRSVHFRLFPSLSLPPPPAGKS